MKNCFARSIACALLMICSLPANLFAADQSMGISVRQRVPDPPPPPPPPCPPAPPGAAGAPDCETLTMQSLRQKYLESEGASKRGLKFYYYATAFFKIHRLNKTYLRNTANYSFNTDTLLAELGPPDYQKKIKLSDSETMRQYAYTFNYKSNKDYVMIVHTVQGLVYRIGYTETALAIDDRWEKFLGNP